MHISEGPIQVYDDRVLNIPVGERAFFFDNTYVTRAEAVERVWHFPEKKPEPVMTATKPWEKFGKYKCVGGFSGKSIVVKGDKLMMFYSIYHMGPGPEFRSFAYAESTDGIRWTKPDLGDGTNLLVRNKPNKEGKGPALPYWEPQNVLWDERSGLYRMMGHCSLTKTKWGTFYASSEDPTKWDTLTFQYAYKNADIHALLGWVPEKSEYWSYPRVEISRGDHKRRAIGRSESKDYRKWSDPVFCHGPRSTDEWNYEIYNMPVEDVGSHILAFPIGYRGTPHGHGPLDTELAYSPNGTDFLQPFAHLPYIPRGLPGEWDDCYVMTSAPVNFKGQTMFFYWGCNFPHDTGFREETEDLGSVGLATLPIDRYCGLACPRHYRGIVDTCLLSCEEAQKVEYDASGSVSLDVIDEAGFLMARGKLPKRFRLRFELQDAELFSFRLTK